MARVQEIERVTRHDVAAFVQSIEEVVGAEYGRWLHFGMTSSDVLDTTLAIQLRDAADELFGDADRDVLDRLVATRTTAIIDTSGPLYTELRAGHERLLVLSQASQALDAPSTSRTGCDATRNKPPHAVALCTRRSVSQSYATITSTNKTK